MATILFSSELVDMVATNIYLKDIRLSTQHDKNHLGLGSVKHIISHMFDRNKNSHFRAKKILYDRLISIME